MDAVQAKDAGSGSEFFEFPVFTNTVLACATFSYEIHDADGEVATLTVDIDSNAGFVRVWPDDVNLIKTYSFFIKAITDSGGETNTGWKSL